MLIVGPGDTTLDLRFDLGQFDPRITLTRASIATHFDSRGNLVVVQANEPRIDYDPASGFCQGLLVEEARTNLLLHSEAFDQSAWVKGGSSVGPAITGPDKAVSALKLVEDSSTGTHQFVQSIAKAASALPYAVTVFAKAGERTLLQLSTTSGANGVSATYDLVGGAVADPATASGVGFTAGSAGIEAVGDGFYRCSLTLTSDATTLIVARLALNNGVGSTYLGDGLSGLYLYGTQLEQATFPTSYIPTTTVAVARAAEVATLLDTGWLNLVEGTLFGEAVTPVVDTPGTQILAHLDDNTVGERHTIFRSVGELYGGVTTDGSATQASIQTGAWAADTLARLAYAYRVNDIAFATVGVIRGTDAAATMPTVDRLHIGTSGALGEQFNGHIRRLIYFPFRLSDNRLAEMTGPIGRVI